MVTNKEKIRIAKYNNQRIKSGVTVPETKVQCPVCKRFLPLDILERHHKVSPKYGGSDKIENLALLCPPDNKKVGAKKKEIKVRNLSDWNDILGRVRREL